MRTTATAVCLTAFALVGPAIAQSTPGSPLVLKMRDGTEQKHHPFGWYGISKTAVSIEGRAEVPRSGVRFVCSRECPAVLPKNEAEQDTVVWQSGEPTHGPVEVACGDYDRCFVVQNGTRRAWHEVHYIQFSRDRT